MSDVKQCDRCQTVVDSTHFTHNPRVTGAIKETSRAATAYNPDEFELCEECTRAFAEFLNEAKDE